MTATALLLLAQIALPPLGYVSDERGRLVPLFGMRGNLLLGEALPAKVRAAATCGGTDVLLSGSSLSIAGDSVSAVDGRILIACDADARTIYAFVPDTGALIRWSQSRFYWGEVPAPPADVISAGFFKGRLIFYSDSKPGIVRWEMDPQAFEIVHSERREAGLAAIDTAGNEWTAAGNRLLCGEKQWLLDERVTSISPLDSGWVLIVTPTRKQITRCDSEDHTVVPSP
jgi:hypothetical protein